VVMSDNISIVTTLKNRAHLFRYNLEALSRQDYDLSKIEICVIDGGSKDNLYSILDHYNDIFTFRIAYADRLKSHLPIVSNCPATEWNLACKYIANYEKILKIDPEIVVKDGWLLSEVNELLDKDDTRMYNARCFFTDSEGWYSSYEDIINDYTRHPHIAEGGFFSRSKFYFCSAFSKSRFLELRGVEELFTMGAGYEDTQFREAYKNRYGNYEYEITATAVHLFHGHNQSRPTKEFANGRMFQKLKKQDLNNVLRLRSGQLVRNENTPWANPAMLSKIYTIKDGSIIDIKDVNDGKSIELDLPF
jgi:glycosyltransferase involved in cell wall biosynthesis